MLRIRLYPENHTNTSYSISLIQSLHIRIMELMVS